MTEPASDTAALEERIARLEAELAAARPPRKREGDWDAYAAIIASLVGLLALAVSGYTAHLQREQLRAQIWPKLGVYNSTLPPPKLMVINDGTGPARVTAVRVMVDGKPARNWDEVKARFGRKDVKFIRSSLNGRVIPAERDLEVVLAGDDEESRELVMDMVMGRGHNFWVTVCYCSVLNECFVTTYGGRPEGERPGDECPVTEQQRFEN